MNSSKIFALGATCAAVCLLQACGGGGGGGGSAGAFPLAGATAAATSSSGNTTSSATTTATGAGNGPVTEAPGSAGTSPTFPTIPTVALPTSAPGLALHNGMYAVSYGMGSVNGQDDKSIWKSTLTTLSDGVQVDNNVYAGNNQLGNDAVAEAKRPLFDPTTSNGVTAQVLRARFDDAKSQLIGGAFSAAGFAPLAAWNVTLEQIDIAGQSIQDFLVANRSVSKPIAGLTVAGTFGAGSNSYRLHYSAPIDRFVFGTYGAFINSQADFERSWACGISSSAATRLAAKYHAGGIVEFLEIAQGTSCTPAEIAAGTPLVDSGSWEQKSSGGINYVQINYPATVSPNRFDPTFLDAEYAAGVHQVMLISNNGHWSSGYLVPAGVTFQSRNLSLNKAGADSVKAATAM